MASLTFSGTYSRDGDGQAPWIQGDPVTINTTMTEADFSNKHLGPAEAQLLAAFIERKFFQDNGALAKLTWSGSFRWKDDDGEWKDPVPVTLDMNMTEADFSKKGLDASGAIILAAFIKRKSFQDNGAMSKLDISGNDIGGYARDGDGQEPWVHSPEGSNALAVIIKSSRSLKELKISNIHLQPEGAKILAPAIQDNGALASLNLAYNKLGVEGAQCLAKVLPTW